MDGNHSGSTRCNAIALLCFLLYSRNPRDRDSSEFTVPRSPKPPEDDLANQLHRQSRRRSERPPKGPPSPTAGRCRLHLLAFSHRPEATHLGDQLRISVRRRVNINHSLGFSPASSIRGSTTNARSVTPESH